MCDLSTYLPEPVADSSPTLPILHKGVVIAMAKIDEDDAQGLSSLKWRLWQRGDKRYAQASVKNKTVFLHRLIVRPREGFVVDHINGDGLDNRRSNLRECSRSMNRLNTAKGKRGVYPHCGKWQASIRLQKKLIHLGTFGTQEMAIRARLDYEKRTAWVA